MPLVNPKPIELTEPQEIEVGNLVVDNFGSHIQTGKLLDRPGWVYVACQAGPNHPVKMYSIGPDGTTLP